MIGWFAAAMLFAASNEVKIETGKLKGATADGVASFKGIPYAAPPVGELRWRPPQGAASWTGVRDATSFGPDCMQKPFPGDAAPLGVTPAEDCLYLNVWAPEKPSSKKMPVMVWIYGGGFVNGGSSPAVYDGSQFAKHGIVFVSFNYRLGRFGFFAHPALTAASKGEPLGNYGYMDQIAALEWVKRNIAAFGGDPGNVTIFGESAGGGSVLTMLTSPMAKGLVHKAIIESGGGRGSLMPARDLAAAEKIGVALAKRAGITGEGNEALAALRKLPAEAVVDGLNMASMGTPTYAGPMMDGKVVIEAPDAAYRAGRGAKVPVIIGANSADIGWPRGNTIDELLKPYGEDREHALAAWDPEGKRDVKEIGIAMAADALMVEPARHFARLVASTGQPAYEYRFSYVAESMRKQWKGAPHATEIPFVMNTVRARYGNDLTPADEKIAAAANAYWANFAKKGDPNGEGLPRWPAYSAEKDVLMDFTLDGPVAKPDPWKDRLDLTERAAERAMAPPAAETTSLTGKWTLHYSIAGYDGDLNCTFRQEATDITGACESEQGSVSVTGSAHHNNVTLQYKTEYNGEQLTVSYAGKRESPAKIGGAVNVQPMGLDGEFTATRANAESSGGR
jgi:para-nitrobenzyl esterase